MKALKVLAAGLCCAAILAGNVQAQQRPSYARPLTAAEARDLAAEIRRLSQRSSVPDPTLRAIAERLQTSSANPGFRTLIGLLQEKAAEAAALRRQIGALRRQVAELADPAMRSTADAALVRANIAIAEGRLADADRQLAVLGGLRRANTEQALKAWEAGVEARAALAELQFDFEKASTIRIAAADTELLDSSLRQWRLLRGAADALYEQASRFRDRAALLRALDLYRNRVLPLVSKGTQPEQWAGTQNSLGIALLKLGDFDDSQAELEQAAEIFRSTFEVYRKDERPEGWAMAQMNLAVALGALGAEYGKPGARDEAIAAYRRALEIYTRVGHPHEWAAIQGNIAIELATTDPGTWILSDDFDPLDDSIALFQEILTVVTREFDPQAWASVQNNLASTLQRRGWRHNGTRDLVEAVGLMRGSLAVTKRTEDPFIWADTQDGLGTTLNLIAERTQSRQLVNEAIAAHRAAMEVYSPSGYPADWAEIARHLATALATRAKLGRSCPDARKALALASEATSTERIDRRAQGSENEELRQYGLLAEKLCK